MLPRAEKGAGLFGKFRVRCCNSCPGHLIIYISQNFLGIIRPEIKKMAAKNQSNITLRTGIYSAIEPERFEHSLDGQVALVTGSGRGIGRAIALALAQAGAAVAVTGRTLSEIEDTAHEVVARGGKSIAIAADVVVKSDMEHLVSQVSVAQLQFMACMIAIDFFLFSLRLGLPTTR